MSLSIHTKDIQSILQRLSKYILEKEWKLQICSAVNGSDYCKNFYYDNSHDFHKWHQMTITQTKICKNCWHRFQVFVDGQEFLSTVNTKPKILPNVKLFASNRWNESFSSDIGSVCHFNMIGKPFFREGIRILKMV